jgi:hypothetical protein
MTSGDISKDRIIAYHEAGHAVAGILYRVLPWRVELGLRGHADGRVSEGECSSAPSDEDQIIREGPRAAWPHLVIDLCGAAAERLVHDDERAITAGAGPDELGARRLAELACRSPVAAGWAGRHDALVLAAKEAASRLVADHYALVQMVAKELVLRRRLDGEEVWDLIKARHPSALRLRMPGPSDG